jgi:molecular chaperone DnaK (HSP70)
MCFYCEKYFDFRKSKTDPRLASRSLLKLRSCSEQAKHVLSTTAGTQCSIDALHDGIDLDCNISRFAYLNLDFFKTNFKYFRLRFEGAANALINDCLKPIDIVLDKAQLQPDDIKIVNYIFLLFLINF